jgi:hypothetical protein
MRKYFPKEKLKILNSKMSLSELINKFPEFWKEVNDEIISVFKSGNAKLINDFTLKQKTISDNWKKKLKDEKYSPASIELSFPHLIKVKMTILSLEKYYLAALSHKTSGKIRLNFLNGFILQKLLFYYDFERKPVSLFWFRFWWHFITQKNILMTLVHKKGIYCFYTKELIKKLKKIIGDRAAIEIAAGDGTLSGFLEKEGVNIKPTDDFSWKNYINYPENVENLDAVKSLVKYNPKVVVCSWPPPGNSFEQNVFEIESVETYIVIGSQYDFASGNWLAYKEQKNFNWIKDRKLAKLVIPKELDNSVFIFERKTD